jgi:hypothetical protein
MTPGATRTGHAQGVPVHTILTTPPVRPEPRRRGRGWAALLFIPALLIGFANNGSGGSGGESGTVTGECWSDPGADPQTMSCDPSFAVTAEDVTASVSPLAPVLRGSQKVSPVPADATVVRVEVVSTTDSTGDRRDARASALKTQIDATAGGVPIASWDQGTPHALDVHLAERPKDLQVQVTVTSGSGTVQCRVYAGSTLVAIDTSTATATCSPAL